MLSFFRRLRRSFASNNRPAMYFRYAVGEILLVVIGILIAVQINYWNEQNKNRRIERAYQLELLKDFEDNHFQAQEVIDRYEELLPMMVELLKQSSLESPTISADSLNWCYGYVEDMPTYSSTDRVYNTIMGSGDLKLMRNQELKDLLSEYYEALHMLNLVQTTHELQLVNSIQPYTIKNLDFQAVIYDPEDDFTLPYPVEPNRILSVVKDHEFRNIVTLKWQISMDLLSQVEYLDEINGDIMDLLRSSK